MFHTVLRIRDVYTGSNFFYPVSRAKRFRYRINELKYFLTKKLFLISKIVWDVHPGSWIRIFSIPDPESIGVKKVPDSQNYIPIPVIKKTHAPQRQRSSRKFTETLTICRDRLRTNRSKTSDFDIFVGIIAYSTKTLKNRHVRGASKIKFKNVNKKRMATARRLIFFGISQGIHC